MKDELTAELACCLIEDLNLDVQDAIEVLYTSETFLRLQDDSTGLYYQSPGYIYSFLQNELLKAKVE
ncbi:MAG: hypothetical protein IJE12_07135 [Prevotella sp.]|nr:hypothetical protein [Prevotella sp.]